MKLVVVGGSTPFTAGLIEAQHEAGGPPGQLVLHGRDARALDLVGRYARHRLGRCGWEVSTTSELAVALTGATVVLHQPRYGDLDARAADERLAAAVGVPADETLGPAGLQAGIRAAPYLRAFASAALAHCRQAVILNLTNPLSVTTALLAADGLITRGLCELPMLTIRRVAGQLDCPLEQLEWSYAGLNHRGFLYGLRAGGECLRPLPAVLSCYGDAGAELAAAGALPLKYFGLFSGDAPHGTGRADALRQIRASILAELAAAPDVRPPSLDRRDMPWYAACVVPTLAAVTSGQPLDTVLNVKTDPGRLVREIRATVSGASVLPLPVADPPGAVADWLLRFDAHERAVLDAVAEPSAARVRTALELDPLVPPDRVDAAATRLQAALAATGGDLRQLGLA